MTTTRLDFNHPPKTGPMMLRAALSRKPGLRNGETIPRFEASMGGVKVSQLSHYQSICGFSQSNIVPIPMPQVIAAPLHVAVLTHRLFPIPVLGVIHVSNRIIQERPIRVDEVLDVSVWIEGHRQARKGGEADLVTEVRVDGVKVWESIATLLSTAAKGHGQKSDPPTVPNPTPTRTAVWTMPSNLGRRYGRIAGDKNPIHLWPITAKLFGFKRHIIHGMWSLGRAMSELDDDIGHGRVQVDVSFKRPVFLPGTATFSAGPHNDGIAFRLNNPQTDKVHLFGSVGFLT